MEFEVVQVMCDLFRGRTDGYGTDLGGCDKVALPEHYMTQAEERDIRLAEYRRRMTAHLVGSAPFGVYPIVVGDWPLKGGGFEGNVAKVRWGCTDLDYVDKPIQAGNLAKLLRKAGVNAWVETSRSKGYHVWSFASEWVPAETMRNAFLACHQLLGLPAKEVNPKQVHLSDGLKFGNYVRTPYPGALSSWSPPYRQSVFDLQTGQAMEVHEFAARAYDQRSPLRAYEKVASRYVAPPPPKQVALDSVDVDAKRLAHKLDKGGYLAFQYGPREGFDRSGSLQRLGHLCREAGLTAGEAHVILRDADSRWGKYSERPDCEEQLMKLVTKAYQ